MTFSATALKYIQPGFKVLDLGAGDGWFSRECIARQALVTAVDVQPPAEQHPDIDWQTMKVEDYVDRLPSTEMFDVIFSRNLIQFLDSVWVEEIFFPTLIQHLKTHGVLAIETFYCDPEPPFEARVSSLFTLDDLKSMMPLLPIVHERQYSETSPDMRGVIRKFFVSEIIVQKNT